MTDYCTSADITENLRNITFSSTTAVTAAAIADIISQESAVIDSFIQNRYTLPITNDTALLFLKKLCVDLVVYRVAKILQPKEQKETADGRVIQDVSNSSAWRAAMKMLQSILEGDTTLPGETPASKSFFSNSSSVSSCDAEFEFCEKQW